MGEDTARRLYEKLDEIVKGQSAQGERLARIEEKMNANTQRCAERSDWMDGVDRHLGDLDKTAASIGGLKGMLAIVISAVAALGAWYQK